MNAKSQKKSIDLKAIQVYLAQVDLNDIDFKSAGSWPLAGRISASILVFVIALILGYFLYLSPLQSELKQLRKQEPELIQTFEIKAFQGANLAAYQEQMRKISSQIEALATQLPNNSQVPELIEKIGEQAQVNRVDIRSLKLLPEEDYPLYLAQPMQLDVVGNFHNISLFIAGIIGLERIVTLHEFSITPDQEQLKLSVRAKAYHSKKTDSNGDLKP
ncbi:type IV pilus assembly protein PilO [Oceanospirillum multiglobuliferum]|uniref:Pilus assembly protein PilP n=1 Tax=Oceanospirillum multiglobuliferum TaxID=64969 RepID=A0A1T4S363_9GAMM|nr:type 4a pilus biogenesis protein PilO [Oceanospirillum multiglobuliferum]OPX54497.1 hypothetical protein BTE48_13935 [Oceanospirillum multiglobuliferum]SKA22587.1 type IV pilus assembly protein PilO [Oceanospirillum multiglobuliferum]